MRDDDNLTEDAERDHKHVGHVDNDLHRDKGQDRERGRRAFASRWGTLAQERATRLSIIIQSIFDPSKFVFPGPSYPRFCAKSGDWWDAPKSRIVCD
jgi:hypothetical protein